MHSEPNQVLSIAFVQRLLCYMRDFVIDELQK
jgi:hypothetical protein